MEQLLSINMVAVIGTSLLMLAVATVWYSVLSFGRSETEIKHNETALELILGGVCYLILITLLAFGDVLIQSVGIATPVFALAMAVFGIVSFVALALPLKKNLIYYTVHCGFLGVFVVGSVFTVHYWPW